MALRHLVGVPIFVGLFACGKGASLPQKPQLEVDRDSIGFGQEFGSGTFIGTKPQESLQISNGGLETLKISEVTYSGDSAFTREGPTETELDDGARAFIRIVFEPTAVRTYEGELTITSNAENAPVKVIQITGKGVAAPDGGP
jgi:hypothetical protein